MPSSLTVLLCFPLTFGWTLLTGKKPSLLLLTNDNLSGLNIFSQLNLQSSFLVLGIDSSLSLSSSRSATKLLTASAVISAADRAACSLKNFIILCLALRVFACCSHCW
uniref:Secreted protein n=1 Tax=Arundo donax TaxID=35708 RepID=A0A0A9H9A6_ARUDO